MAENVNPLIIPIGADVSQFEKSINDVKVEFKSLYDLIKSTPFNLVKAEDKKQLEDLGRTLKTLEANLKEVGNAAVYPANSIRGIKDQIEELNRKKLVLDAKTSAKEIIELNREIDRLKDKLTNINNLGSASGNGFAKTLPASFNTLSNSSKQARISLTNLSLVAQDLPFGFIGIQNNLPNLFQSFNNLTKTSNGLKGAFAAIGQSLIGPAGIFLAFSAVTSAITIAVQNYGSLGNALDALLGKQTALSIETFKAAESLKEFNKEFKTSDQLIRSSQAGTEGQNTRIKALSKIVLDQTKTFEERNSALNQLKKIDEDYFYTIDLGKTSYKQLTNAVDSYVQTLKFAASAKALEERISTTNTELSTQRELLKGLQNNLDELKRKEITIQGVAATRKDQEDIKNAQSAVNAQIAIINSLERSLNTNKNALNAFIVKQIQLKAPVEAATEAFKKQEDAADRAAKAAARAVAKGSIGTITQGEALNNGVITSDIGLLTKIIEANVRLTNLAVDRIRRYRDKEEIKPLDLMPKKLDKKAGVPMSAELEKQVGATLLQLDALSNKFAQTNEALQSAFFEPLSSAFEEFFETGKLGFKEFGKSIINTIKQIVAKIIATGIINLLASILSGGSTSLAGGVASAAKGINIGRAFGDAFKSVLGIGANKVAAPSFSGVGSGGMQMQGQVVFVQRGSDLVGVLNRTNGTINRVG